MRIEDKHFALETRAKAAWMQLMDIRQLVNYHPECLPLPWSVEIELRRIVAEASHLLERHDEAAGVPALAKAAE